MTENVRIERVMMDRAMASTDTNSLPSAREFLALSRKHSLVPVYRTVTADLETPVSAFLRIASEEPEAFLLESRSRALLCARIAAKTKFCMVKD